MFRGNRLSTRWATPLTFGHPWLIHGSTHLAVWINKMMVFRKKEKIEKEKREGHAYTTVTLQAYIHKSHDIYIQTTVT